MGTSSHSMRFWILSLLNGAGRPLYERDAIEEFGNRWFLLKTNVGKERVAVGQVKRVAADVLLPLMQIRVRRWDKLVPTVRPLFPSYLFAMFHFEQHYGQVRYARGVRELVCFGSQPAIVQEWIM